MDQKSLFVGENRTVDWVIEEEVQKIIDIFNYKLQLLSIDVKTKVVHVPRIIFNVFKVFRFSSFQSILVPSASLTFRHFSDKMCHIATESEGGREGAVTTLTR